MRFRDTSIVSIRLPSIVAESMSEEQIREVVTAVLAELEIEKPAPSDKGKIMKVLMPKVKGKADGKAVNEILASMMK